MHRIEPEHRECHPYRIHIAKTLHRLILDLDVKGVWLSHCLGVTESMLSDYRTANRAIPAYRALMVDELLGTDVMAEAMASIGGFHLVHKSTENLTAADLQRLFPLILREQGNAGASIAGALMDNMLDGAERDTIHRHAAKLRRFWQDVEERTA